MSTPVKNWYPEYGMNVYGDQKGYFVASLSVMISVILIAASPAFSHTNLFKTKYHYTINKDAFRITEANLKSLLENQDIWDKNVKHNPDLKKCLNGKCFSKEQVKNEMEFLGIGQEVLVSNKLAIGLNHAGEPCNLNLPTCNFKYEVKWFPMCTDSNCTSPPILINVELFRKSDKHSLQSFYKVDDRGFSIVKL